MSDVKPKQKVTVRFNGHWYPGVVIRTTPKRVECRFWTRGGERERVKIVPRDYVCAEGEVSGKVEGKPKAKPSILIPANDLPRAVYPKGAKWTLEELQAHVGGYIEPLYRTHCQPGNLMLVDEDGLSKGLPPNNRATLKAGRPIVGTALIVPMELME
jgi:hypothetical protein